jgi:hypothetical protein
VPKTDLGNDIRLKVQVELMEKRVTDTSMTLGETQKLTACRYVLEVSQSCTTSVSASAKSYTSKALEGDDESDEVNVIVRTKGDALYFFLMQLVAP